MTEKFDFEGSLGELENIVARMESGDLTLEESLAAFERGIVLTRNCQKALAEAEQRVQVLLGDPDDPDSLTRAPFDDEDADD